MKFIKNNWKYGLLGIGFAFMLLYFFSPRVKHVKVPIKIEVPVPVIQKEFDTVYVPKPYKVLKDAPINKKLKDSLSKAKSVIDSLNAYKNFAIKRKYTQIFDDSTQTITVFAETTGTLDALQAKYKTKPIIGITSAKKIIFSINQSSSSSLQPFSYINQAA